jgi:peptidoglycan/LPS O-acetylase OafA/YrhL
MTATLTRPARDGTATGPLQPRRRWAPPFRGDIEGLRGVAVLLVVTFHVGVPFLSGGFVGVDVFFVLSGFLITGLLVDELRATGRISLHGFYARRIRRLLPLATLVLAATAAGTYALVPAVDRGGVGGDIVAAALSAANWRFAAESTQYMADVDKSPLLHYWSLSVEEQFYIVWPLLLLLVAGRSGVARRAWRVASRRIALALALVAAGSLALSVATTVSSPSVAYFGLHTRGWELAAGGLLALARAGLPAMTRRAALGAGWLGAALVAGSLLLIGPDTPFPGAAALAPVLGTVLLLAAGARLPDGGVSRVLGHRSIRYVGRVSYAWYLWHWPCLVIADARWPQLQAGGTPDGAARAAWPVVLAAVVMSFALAVASHHLVEQPLRRWAFLSRSKVRSMRFGVGLVATSLVAATALLVASFVSARLDERQLERSLELQADSVSQPAETAKPTIPVVTMTPEQAREDTPGGPEGCYVTYASTAVPSAEHCRLGPARGSKVVALIGDSHADQYEPAMEQVAKRRGWTVYVFAKAACTVTDTPVWAGYLKGPYPQCATWRDAVLQRLAALGHLDAVVVGQWHDYTGLAMTADGKRLDATDVAGPWREGARRSFDRLAKVTDRVVVLRDSPRPPEDVPTCLSREKDAAACAFPKEGSTGLDRVIANAEKAAAPTMVRFADLTDQLCPTARCPVVAPTGQVMYRDRHHLAASYSATLAEPLAEALEEAMAGA